MQTIGFIGGGNMAQALIAGILEKKLFAPSQVWVSDVRPQRLAELRRLYGVQVTQVNTELTAAADIVVLSVKPQGLEALLGQIAGTLRPESLVISVVAGKTSGFILEHLGHVSLIRVMPNTPALVGAGAAGLFNATAPPRAAGTTKAIFEAVGIAVMVEDESLMDAVTAVSGSGPAYVFLLMEAMMRAGIDLGLDDDTATELVLQTACGAAQLARNAHKNRQSLSSLRKNVTSPGGTTEAAITTFQAAGFDALVQKALTAARDRGRELSA